MKKLILFVAIAFSVLISKAQLNMTLQSHIDFQPLHNTGCSNLWGYVDELNNEYAVIGLNSGTSIVDVTDPANPVEVFYLPDSNSVWREVKVWQDYAYVTTERDTGVLIIDLSPLPGSTVLPNYRFFGPAGNRFTSAHSLFIDENGILYIHGSNRGNGGVIFYDLSVDPINPPEVGQYDAYYVHDSYARGDTLYTAHVYDGFFSVIDVSDKSNPIVLATQTTPAVFTHNVWLSDNGDYLFTTDEVSGAPIGSYDISDLANIQELDQARSNPGSGSIPHNTYFLNNYLITSYYRDGVLIHDATDPANLIEVGNYDVSALSGDGFNSIWGVYPYFPSGTIITSDIENGLYVFSANYTRGCYLNGTVTDAVSTNPILNATITIIGQGITDYSDVSGDYQTGIGIAGTYDVAFSKPGYVSDTAHNVALINGSTIIFDMALVPLVPVTVSGQITEQGTGNPIANAEVLFTNSLYTFNTTTDASGNYMISTIYEEDYSVYIGHWGHWTDCVDGLTISGPVNTYSTTLKKGFYDDFTFDFGWIVTPGASAGNWVRDVPIATGITNGTPSNPHFDVPADCGNQAFMTGNQSGTVGAADVDGGPTVLTSPVFDATQYTDPWINYSHWFFNYFNGFTQPNDTLFIYLNNGITTVQVEQVRDDNFVMSEWIDTSIHISSYLTPTANMTLILSVADYDASGGNLCEAAIDRFIVTEGNVTGHPEPVFSHGVLLYPNPSNDKVMLYAPGLDLSGASVSIFDVSGKLTKQLLIRNTSDAIDVSDCEKGIYLLHLVTGAGEQISFRLIKN